MNLIHKIYNSGIFLFLRELFNNPAAVGAAWPSSKKLAQTMAKQALNSKPGTIVELGAGTGVVTQALLAEKVLPEHIIVIERSSVLCEHLKKRFPDIKIINGDAQDLKKLIAAEDLPISVVVSSLPLRAMPGNVVATIEQQIVNALEPHGMFIQFTYDMRKHSITKLTKFTHLYSRYVWFNFPPARVDVYQI